MQPLTPSFKKAEHWERNSPYVQTIINLIHDMVNDESPEGYAINEPIKPKLIRMTPGINIKLLFTYRGNHLTGETWLVKNNKLAHLYLHPRQFYQENTLAAAVEDEVLGKGDETLLYRVIKNG